MEGQSKPTYQANILLGTQFLSDFGDQITYALLALCILDITKSAGKVGFIYFISTFGYLLFTLLGGMLGDHLSKRNILCFADLGRGLIILFMIFALKEKSIEYIYAASFCLSILGALHGPVKMSTWAEAIPADSLERYNSLSEFSIHASTVAGPLIASLFIMQDWVSFGFVLDAVTFFICGAIFFRLASKKSSLDGTTQPKRNLFQGFKLISKHKEFAKYIGYDAIQMMGFGAFNATFLVLAQRDFGWSKVEYSYHLSIVAALTALGALIGAMPRTARINPAIKLVSGALISAVAFFIALQIKMVPFSSLLVGICDGIAVLTIAVTRTKIQLLAKNTYPDNISSIMASRAIVIKAATLFGIGACLLIDDFISLEATLMLFIIPIALSCLPILSIKKVEIGSLVSKAPNEL